MTFKEDQRKKKKRRKRGKKEKEKKEKEKEKENVVQDVLLTRCGAIPDPGAISRAILIVSM